MSPQIDQKLKSRNSIKIKHPDLFQKQQPLPPQQVLLHPIPNLSNYCPPS